LQTDFLTILKSWMLHSLSERESFARGIDE